MDTYQAIAFLGYNLMLMEVSLTLMHTTGSFGRKKSRILQ
jgi:hypothetical protein